jgi:glutamate--cysteine ligase
MCNTASVQINVGLGAGNEVARRWHVAHRIGPVLLAAFANSGLAGGQPSGWKSARMRAWWGIDATRTAPVSTTRTIDPDPASAWARYALDANVLLVRRPDDEWEPLSTPLPLRAWLEHGHPAGWPTADDIAYHLTTLFPPIRPRGWLELRYLDSLPTPYWHVAVAVATALLDDDEAADTALAATEGVADQWVRASREGLDDPGLAAAARACFAAAAEALDRAGADDATIALVDDYRERFVEQSWCPADERAQAFALHGSLHPAAESPIPYARLSAYLS